MTELEFDRLHEAEASRTALQGLGGRVEPAGLVDAPRVRIADEVETGAY